METENTQVQRPTMADSEKLGRVFGYLQETKDQTMTLNCGNFNNITVYIDAAFGIHDDGTSHSGCAVYLGGAFVCVLCTRVHRHNISGGHTTHNLKPKPVYDLGLCAFPETPNIISYPWISATKSHQNPWNPHFHFSVFSHNSSVSGNNYSDNAATELRNIFGFT